MTGFVGTREFDLNCFRPLTTIPAIDLLIHYFLGLKTGNPAFFHNGFVSRFLGAFLAFSSLGGIGLQASIWEDPAQRATSSWEADFEASKTEYGAGHRGVDFALEADLPIHAPAAGVLYFKGMVVDREVVTIRTADGYLASFEPACTDLEVGDHVEPGQDFAWHCPPSPNYEYHCKSCVHFSARSAFGYISPDYLLGSLKPSVLAG
ncbi:MAG: hypothetical protein RL028_730 [Actinomycetota bacterium]